IGRIVLKPRGQSPAHGPGRVRNYGVGRVVLLPFLYRSSSSLPLHFHAQRRPPTTAATIPTFAPVDIPPSGSGMDCNIALSLQANNCLPVARSKPAKENVTGPEYWGWSPRRTENSRPLTLKCSGKALTVSRKAMLSGFETLNRTRMVSSAFRTTLGAIRESHVAGRRATGTFGASLGGGGATTGLGFGCTSSTFAVNCTTLKKKVKFPQSITRATTVLTEGIKNSQAWVLPARSSVISPFQTMELLLTIASKKRDRIGPSLQSPAATLAFSSFLPASSMRRLFSMARPMVSALRLISSTDFKGSGTTGSSRQRVIWRHGTWERSGIPGETKPRSALSLASISDLAVRMR